MKLSPLEKTILSAIDVDAVVSVEALAKKIRARSHVVRYTLHALTNKSLYRPKVLINPYILGYMDYVVLFSISAKEHGTQREKLLQMLTQSKEVSWVGEVGGRYHYGVSVLAVQISDALQFFDSITRKFGRLIHERSFALRHASNIYGKRYLDSKVSNPPLRYSAPSLPPIQLDELDKKILSYFSKSFNYNISSAARALGMIPSTLERRISRLIKEEVIIGYYNSISGSIPQIERYKIILKLRGMSSTFKKAIDQFCLNTPYCTHLIECLGSWDYELGIEVPSGKDTISITNALYRDFSSEIVELEVLPEFTCLKFVNCPWL